MVQTSDISIRSIRKQSMIYPLGLVNTKQREFRKFVSSFVLLLAYASTMFLCLCLICRSICRRRHCIPLFCLLFVLMLMPLACTRLKRFCYAPGHMQIHGVIFAFLLYRWTRGVACLAIFTPFIP